MTTETLQQVSKLSFGTKFAYGIGQVAEQIKNQGFNAFLFFYFTQVLGLAGTLAGAAVLTHGGRQILRPEAAACAELGERYVRQARAAAVDGVVHVRSVRGPDVREGVRPREPRQGEAPITFERGIR